MQKLVLQNIHAGYSWTGWSGFFLSLYVQANVSHTNLVNVKFLVMNKFVNEMWWKQTVFEIKEKIQNRSRANMDL